MRIMNLFVVLIIFLFCYSPNLYANWKFVSPMPHGRYWHDATLGKDGKIYVMGGAVFEVSDKEIIRKYNDGRYSNLVYDPCQDKWEYKAIVPGRILSSGQFLIFDEAKGEWKYKRKKSILDKEEMKFWYMLPDKYQNYPGKIRYTDINRQGAGVAIVTILNGQIWWIGGRNFISPGDSLVFAYDPSSDIWRDVILKEFKKNFGHVYNPGYHTDIPRMHEQRCYHEAVMTSDAKIYVLGGGRIEDREDVYTNTMECYDPKSNTWEYKAPYKTSIIRFAAIVGFDDKIYVFGGGTYESVSNTFLIFNDVEVYDPKKDVWTSRKPMPGPRCGHAGVLGSDGMMYIMGGGVFRGPPLRDVWIYDPIKDTWEKGPKMQVPRSSLAAVSTPDGMIYAIGGTDLGSHEIREAVNIFIPEDYEIYKGKVQDTVEVLDISEL